MSKDCFLRFVPERARDTCFPQKKGELDHPTILGGGSQEISGEITVTALTGEFGKVTLCADHRTAPADPKHCPRIGQSKSPPTFRQRSR
ncbi:MAG: hypothetical protein WDZ67_01060 [Patescibacteria group bacterium]